MSAPRPAEAVRDAPRLLDDYQSVRALTLKLIEPLEPEDMVVQSMTDVSPTRWHLAHTTWFFERFVLARAVSDYRPFHPAYESLFNSYYNTVGTPFPRPRRGLLSRPTVREVVRYRHAVDERMADLLERGDAERLAPHLAVVELGLQHEQQHQELMLMDILHVLAQNPLCPVYRDVASAPERHASPLSWIAHGEGLREIGASGPSFAFDNETPRHRVFVEAFEIANRPVTNREFLAFLENGGYERADLWLSDGWATLQKEGLSHPLYWRREAGGWHEFSLRGLAPLDLDAPVCHLSHYEADAHARWADARLPTEAEWEVACRDEPVEGNFLEDETLRPLPGLAHASSQGGLLQPYGDVWEWTASAYLPYPGYRTPEGALGEYNGKFMSNQVVLRGGCCVTPRGHVRATYRNFYAPATRWHFSGIRLAR